MQKRILMLATSAFILACGATTASAHMVLEMTSTMTAR